MNLHAKKKFLKKIRKLNADFKFKNIIFNIIKKLLF